MWKRCTVEWYLRGSRHTVHTEALSVSHAKKLVSRPRGARKVSAHCSGSGLSGTRKRRRH